MVGRNRIDDLGDAWMERLGKVHHDELFKVMGIAKQKLASSGQFVLEMMGHGAL